MKSTSELNNEKLGIDSKNKTCLSELSLAVLKIIASSDFFVKALFSDENSGIEGIETDVECIIFVRDRVPFDITIDFAIEFQKEILDLDFESAKQELNLSSESLTLLKNAASCRCLSGLLINADDLDYYGLEVDVEPIIQLRACYPLAASNLKTAEAMLEALRADLFANA